LGDYKENRQLIQYLDSIMNERREREVMMLFMFIIYLAVETINKQRNPKMKAQKLCRYRETSKPVKKQSIKVVCGTPSSHNISWSISAFSE
jgi:hypothetical protein